MELDEVENVFCSLDPVAEAAAVKVADGTGNAEIRVSVLLKKGAHADERSLRLAASKKLPAYALPSHIDLAADLPRTSSGKIDRLRLERADRTGPG